MADRPTIDFPCDYPIKVIGVNAAGLRDLVLAIVRRHAPDLREDTVTVRDSRAGRYCSVRLSIRATGERQLRALHEALLAEPLVKLVL